MKLLYSATAHPKDVMNGIASSYFEVVENAYVGIESEKIEYIGVYVLTKNQQEDTQDGYTKNMIDESDVKKLVEEVLQNEIQDQLAWFMGSDRDMPTWWERLTTFWISSVIWSILQWWNVVIDINQHKELKAAFDEWSEAVDKIAPWVSKSDKEKLFSAIVAAEIEDANMSEDLVNKYEAQTTELYNKIDELNAELETTTNENRKQEINRQIEDANQKIKDIDEIINSANKVTEEVNAKLQELSQQEIIWPQEEKFS